MSIQIIGSNDKPLTIIIQNEVPNKIDNIQLEYDLLINKYQTQINKNIIDKKKYKHLINQLTNLFNFDDFEDLVIYLNNINNLDDLEKIIWIFLDQFNLYSKLDECLLKIIDKLILLNLIKKKNYFNLIIIIF